MFLNFTSVLWAPQIWLYWVYWTLFMSNNAVFMDLEAVIGTPTPPCMTYEAKKEAVFADPSDVSGWYGPGAYLAWLFTVYVGSISSIWNSGNSKEDSNAVTSGEKDEDAIDGELLAALTYPAIAILDIIYRLIRCKVDPTLDASMLVLCVGTFAISTTRRLASPPDMETWTNGDFFPSGKREWTISIFLLTCHAIIQGTVGEPYHSYKLMVTIYALAMGSILYTSFRTERLMDLYPYRKNERASQMGRVAVFVLLQVVFFIVIGYTRHNVMPRTGAKLSDLDQCATLITVVVATIFTRRKAIMEAMQQLQVLGAGFRRVRSVPSDW